jgi:hypothetical protein
MSFQFLKAEQQTNQYYFQVLLDSSKVQADGTPDPNYVKEYSFLLTPAADQTTAQYLASIKDMIGSLALYELAQIEKNAQSSTPTPLEGFTS